MKGSSEAPSPCILETYARAAFASQKIASKYICPNIERRSIKPMQTGQWEHAPVATLVAHKTAKESKSKTEVSRML